MDHLIRADVAMTIVPCFFSMDCDVTTSHLESVWEDERQFWVSLVKGLSRSKEFELAHVSSGTMFLRENKSTRQK